MLSFWILVLSSSVTTIIIIITIIIITIMLKEFDGKQLNSTIKAVWTLRMKTRRRSLKSSWRSLTP